MGSFVYVEEVVADFGEAWVEGNNYKYDDAPYSIWEKTKRNEADFSR